MSKKKHVFRPINLSTADYHLVLHREDCFYCGRRFDCHQASWEKEGKPKGKVVKTKDHVVPKVHGGHGNMANTVGACMQCNNLKGSLPMRVFTARLQEQWVGLRENTYKAMQAPLTRADMALWNS